MAQSKIWNRRAAVIGGALLATGAGALAWHGSGKKHVRLAGADTLLRGNAGEPDTIDPALASGIQEGEIIGDLMVGLMTPDAMARPVPGMASHWQTSPDGLTWTFHLRQAQWSDGEPVTAEDFVYAWRRALTPETASTYAYFLYPLKNAVAVNNGKLPGTALGVRALDATTLEIHLEHPAPYLLEMLTHQTMSPVPQHVVESKGREWVRPGSYVGNGPFVLKEWVPNGHVLLEKNPRFYEADQVALKHVYFYPTDDYGAALDRMRNGELDTQDKLPGEKMDWIRANLPQLLHDMPNLTTEIIAVNFKRKPFDDIRVREALNLAINREALTQRIRRVGDMPAYAIVPPTTANYPGGAAFDFKTMRPADRVEKARSLMRAAGFNENNRVKTTYMIRSTTPGGGRAVAAAVQQMLAQVYIDAAIIPNDMAIFYLTIQVHNFDICQSGWAADFNDASTFLELLQTGGGNNWGEYSNSAYDALLDAAQADVDIVSRGKKLVTAEAIALKDHALMPIWFWNNSNLVWPYVKGWEANPMDFHRSRWVSIDQAARLKQFA